MRTGASGYPVCQPVYFTLSYSWSWQSQPSTTSQKPKPPSSDEMNLSREMYLPRMMPSMSKTPTFTCCTPRLSTNSRASVALRTCLGSISIS